MALYRHTGSARSFVSPARLQLQHSYTVCCIAGGFLSTWVTELSKKDEQCPRQSVQQERLSCA